VKPKEPKKEQIEEDLDWENDDALDDVINNNIQASELQETKKE
jgi:hypothetical protein